MTLADLDEVVAIERVSFHAMDAGGSVRDPAERVARCSVMPRVVRWWISLPLGDRSRDPHHNLAVHPDWRHRGVGRAILAAALSEAWPEASPWPSSRCVGMRPPSRSMGRLGFQIIGRRSGYYFDTVKSLVMEARLRGDTAGRGGEPEHGALSYPRASSRSEPIESLGGIRLMMDDSSRLCSSWFVACPRGSGEPINLRMLSNYSRATFKRMRRRAVVGIRPGPPSPHSHVDR